MLNAKHIFVAAPLAAWLAGCNWIEGTNVAQQPSASGQEQADETAPNNDPFAFLAAYGGSPRAQPAAKAHRNAADPYYILGRQMPEWQLAEWTGSQPLTLAGQRGRTVVVHFWSDESALSMKAMQRLAEEFRMHKVTFVGAYCSTGRLVENDWDQVQALAEKWGVDFPLAYDRQWSTLNSWWLSRYDNLPLTPTFVLDAEGTVAHVHPGPALFPSDDPLERLCNDDFEAMRRAIRRELAGQIAKSVSQ